MSINITKIILKPLDASGTPEIKQPSEVNQAPQSQSTEQAPKPPKPPQAPKPPQLLKAPQPELTPLASLATTPEQAPTPVESEAKQEETHTRIFQAIGVITGDVAFIKDETKDRYIANITIGNSTYNLFPQGSSWGKQASFMGLRKEIESTGITRHKLIVYPNITHYPDKEQEHRVAFQLVAFEKADNTENVVSKELTDLEFKISGLWQFIPVCKTPCITIMRNFSEERLTYMKQAEVASKVNFMKASHIPLIWRDSPVKPFRFNPKLEKEQQGKAMFVTIKARFIPGRDVFGFDSMQAVPQDEPPKHLKAGKKDKAEVLKSKLASKRASSQSNSEKKAPSSVNKKKTVTKSKPSLEGMSPALVVSKPKLKPKK